jgi:hypothetical protein
MAESLDSRKFERKSQFDVPLPIRKMQRGPVDPTDEEVAPAPVVQPNTMAFSLMTKKGNRQQASTPAWMTVRRLCQHPANHTCRPERSSCLPILASPCL